MSKISYIAMVDSGHNGKCTDLETEAMLYAFEHLVKQTATTLVHKAWFELKDYEPAKEHGIDRFNLMLERRTVKGHEQWWGSFEYGSKKLKVIGTLEK